MTQVEFDTEYDVDDLVILCAQNFVCWFSALIGRKFEFGLVIFKDNAEQMQTFEHLNICMEIERTHMEAI